MGGGRGHVTLRGGIVGGMDIKDRDRSMIAGAGVSSGCSVEGAEW
jgi:hypothetical protein